MVCETCKGVAQFVCKLTYLEQGKYKDVYFCSEKCFKEFTNNHKFDLV